MKSFVKWIDKQSRLVKLLFCIPVIDIIWTIYRICRSGAKNSVLGVVLGVILLFVGIPILWLIDLITILLMNKVLWID